MGEGYVEKKLPVVKMISENRLPEIRVDVLVCGDCGAVVGDTDQHEAFHDREHYHDYDPSEDEAPAVQRPCEVTERNDLTSGNDESRRDIGSEEGT